MKTDAKKYRCPFTVDWVRNQADAEILQLVLIEVPQQAHKKVVLDLGADTVSKSAGPQKSVAVVVGIVKGKP